MWRKLHQVQSSKKFIHGENRMLQLIVIPLSDSFIKYIYRFKDKKMVEINKLIKYY